MRPYQVTETKTGRRWIDASDSDDSDDDVRAPIRSAHDKKWDGLVAATKAVNNLLKNADWNKLQDGGWVGGCGKGHVVAVVTLQMLHIGETTRVERERG